MALLSLRLFACHSMEAGLEGRRCIRDGPLEMDSFRSLNGEPVSLRPLCAILNTCAPLKALGWGIVGSAVLSANDRESH